MPDAKMHEFKYRLQRLSRKWIDQGLPSRQELEKAADALSGWKVRHRVRGIWTMPPSLITATLDDGMGHGLALIEQFAAVMGASVNRLGLLQLPETIIAACIEAKPDFLGLTVLQLDSDDALAMVGRNLFPGTRLIAGGPAFQYDRDMAQRCAVDHVAKNVAYFMDFLMNWAPGNAPAL
jgi:hypothetical protein